MMRNKYPKKWNFSLTVGKQCLSTEPRQKCIIQVLKNCSVNAHLLTALHLKVLLLYLLSPQGGAQLNLYSKDQESSCSLQSLQYQKKLQYLCWCAVTLRGRSKNHRRQIVWDETTNCVKLFKFLSHVDNIACNLFIVLESQVLKTWVEHVYERVCTCLCVSVNE